MGLNFKIDHFLVAPLMELVFDTMEPYSFCSLRDPVLPPMDFNFFILNDEFLSMLSSPILSLLFSLLRF